MLQKNRQDRLVVPKRSLAFFFSKEMVTIPVNNNTVGTRIVYTLKNLSLEQCPRELVLNRILPVISCISGDLKNMFF